MARETSAEAYRQITASGLLQDLQLATYKACYDHGPMTDHEIALKIGKPRDTASPRVRELIARGVLREVGERKCQVTDRTCRIVDVTANLPSAVEARDTKSRPVRVPRTVLLEILRGIDSAMTCVLMHAEQRRAGNRARQLLSEQL